MLKVIAGLDTQGSCSLRPRLTHQERRRVDSTLLLVGGLTNIMFDYR